MLLNFKVLPYTDTYLNNQQLLEVDFMVVQGQVLLFRIATVIRKYQQNTNDTQEWYQEKILNDRVWSFFQG